MRETPIGIGPLGSVGRMRRAGRLPAHTCCLRGHRSAGDPTPALCRSPGRAGSGSAAPRASLRHSSMDVRRVQPDKTRPTFSLAVLKGASTEAELGRGLRLRRRYDFAGASGDRAARATLALAEIPRRARWHPRVLLAHPSRNPGQTNLCACETCRARCRGCQVSQILLALCFSAVSYYDDAVSEVEPAGGLHDIAHSGFKQDPAMRRLCSRGGDGPEPAQNRGCPAAVLRCFCITHCPSRAQNIGPVQRPRPSGRDRSLLALPVLPLHGRHHSQRRQCNLRH